eukprot:CAMPEP_0171113672 /NCGR_PEP_ID=MMETSP0766_2-20121228/83156_1 /TAXON_ID=439317 /ORGANISM="Gambierdiscus australes, Strain CAWD 149" /LENGTH=260 /DNA_ID=CAMNT_0011575901 /DNA_START=50 /DNA_END=832 /DNA_ORIENTATION=+
MLGGESLSKLSIAELKKRIFWCGASVPPGHLEKADLVAVLTKSLDERAERERERQQKAEQQKAEQQRAQCGAVRPDARPINYDKKLEGPEQETVDLHIQPEEELKRRIEELGGTIPEGKVSKFYLIALLKNCRRQQAEANAHVEAVDSSEKAGKVSPPIDVTDADVQSSAAAAPGLGRDGRSDQNTPCTALPKSESTRRQAGSAPATSRSARGKRRRPESQVLVSDDEDDDEDQVRAVGAAPINLVDDDEVDTALVAALE